MYCELSLAPIKVRGAGCLISSFSSDVHIFTPWSVDLFIRVPSQLYGEQAVLQLFQRIEVTIPKIAISVLPGTHFPLSQVKHLRVKCTRTQHRNNVSVLRREKHYISLKILHQVSGIRNLTAGSDIDKTLTIVPRPSLFCTLKWPEHNASARIQPLFSQLLARHSADTSLSYYLLCLAHPSAHYQWQAQRDWTWGTVDFTPRRVESSTPRT